MIRHDLVARTAPRTSAVAGFGGDGCVRPAIPGCKPASRAACMSAGRLSTPFITPGPPCRQCTLNSRGGPVGGNEYAVTCKTTSVPPSITAAEDSSLTTGPSSRTLITTIRENLPASKVTSAVTSVGLRRGMRRSSARAKHPELSKKFFRPVAAATSRSTRSFWSGRHSGAQRTRAVAEPSQTGGWGEGLTVMVVLAHPDNANPQRRAKRHWENRRGVTICVA